MTDHDHSDDVCDCEALRKRIAKLERQWPPQWLMGIVAAALISAGGWHTYMAIRHEAGFESVDMRLEGLESGRTIKMAAETRAELNALWRQLSQLEKIRP